MARADEIKARSFHQRAVDRNPQAKDGDPKLVRWSFIPDHGSHARFIRGIIGLESKPKRILEAGSGWGEVAHFLAREFYPETEYLGVDIFDRFLEHAKREFEDQNLRFEKESFWDVLGGADPGYYDWVVAVGCLFGYVGSYNWERLWRLIWRATLRGMVVLFDYRRPVPTQEWFEEHLQEWGQNCPNFQGKYNLKISDVRRMTGWPAKEVKLRMFPYFRCVYFDKGPGAPKWDGEIPEYQDPSDFEVLGN